MSVPFQVQGYSAEAFAYAVCDFKRWRGRRATVARRAAELCADWTRTHSPKTPSSHANLTRYVKEQMSPGLLVFWFIVRIVIAYWLQWLLEHYQEYRAAEQE